MSLRARVEGGLVTHLDLSKNGLAVVAGKAVAALLAAPTNLVCVDLSWNSICRRGAQMVRPIEAHRSPTATACSRTRACAWQIAQSLKVNTTLQSLDLSWNGLADGGGAGTPQPAISMNPPCRSVRYGTPARCAVGAGGARNR